MAPMFDRGLRAVGMPLHGVPWSARAVSPYPDRLARAWQEACAVGLSGVTFCPNAPDRCAFSGFLAVSHARPVSSPPSRPPRWCSLHRS